MPTVSQTIEAVSYVTGFPRSRVNQMARRLIDDGVWPKAQGRQIPEIEPDEALRLIVAVAFADRVADASKVADQFAGLPLRADPDMIEAMPWLSNASDALRAFGEALAGRDICKQTVKLHMSMAGRPSVEIQMQFADKALTLPYGDQASWGSFARRAFELSPEALQVLGNLLDRPDEGLEFK